MPGTDLNLDLPTLADPLSTIVTKIVTALEVIEDDLTPAITSGETNFTTELYMSGAPITGVGGVRITGGVSAVVGTVYFDDDGDLHAVTTDGDVQITDGGEVAQPAEAGAIEHPFQACAFQQASGGAGALTTIWTGAATYRAALSFPVGTTITDIIWTYSRGGAGTVTVNLVQQNRTDGSTTNIGSNADSTGATFENNTQTYNHEILADKFYFLEVICSDAANVLMGAVVKADT